MRSFVNGMRVLALGCLLAVPAAATSVLPVDAGQAVDEAELIFTGQVIDVEMVSSGDGLFPFTFVTFSVDQTLKGAADANHLTMRFDGGDLPEREESIEVVGVPIFEVGQEVLLFVSGNGKRACPLVGWWQGRLDFVQHPTRGTKMLVDHRGAPIEGIANGDWQRSEVRWDAAHRRLVDQEPGAKLLWQEGVSIDEPETVTAKSYRGESADSVLDALRQLVSKRSAEKSFVRSAPVASASPLDVPESVEFTAVAGR